MNVFIANTKARRYAVVARVDGDYPWVQVESFFLMEEAEEYAETLEETEWMRRAAVQNFSNYDWKEDDKATSEKV